MNKRGAGVIFCLIAALLFIAKYVCAAIFGSGVVTWSSELFQAMMSYIGSGLNVCSIIALIIGIFYLIWAEKDKNTN